MASASAITRPDMVGAPGRSGRKPLAPADRKRTVGISISPDTHALFEAFGPGKHQAADAILRDGFEKLAGDKK